MRLPALASPATEPRRSAVTPLERLGIVALLVAMGAVGYSAWRTHTVRTQVAEAVGAARALAPLVAHSFRRHGEVRVDRALADATELARAGSELVAALTVVDGRIDIAFGLDADEAIAGRQISLTPYESADLDIVWVCGTAPPGPGLHPLGFAGGGRRAHPVPVTIEPRYLPSTCR